MASNQVKGTLYTYPGNIRAYKAQIAAQFSGAQLTIADEKKFHMNETTRSEAYLDKFPTGRVPAFEDVNGVYLFEANAIAHYVSNNQLRGGTPLEQSQVFQWIEYGDRDIMPVTTTLVYPCLGILQYNKNSNDHAKEELKHILHLLDKYLSKRTYLVGERITLADITIAIDLLLLFQWIIEPSVRESHINLTRWFLTLMDQKEFRAVLGKGLKLCEHTAQHDAKRFAELQRKNSVPSTQPAPHDFSHHTNTTTASTQENKTKKEKKPAKQEEKKVEEPADAAGDDDEMDEVYANEPKQKDPFADMPKPTLNIDEFKRVYSNEDTATKALPYFWTNFDKNNCSLWFCQYRYSDELTQVFMTCNLVSGMFQRLDKLRKNAFGSMCVFGENNNNTIAGVWFWRGQDLAFELSPDWKVDYASYTWTKLNPDDENTKQLVNQFFLWEGEFKGKKFNQGKIFK